MRLQFYHVLRQLFERFLCSGLFNQQGQESKTLSLANNFLQKVELEIHGQFCRFEHADGRLEFRSDLLRHLAACCPLLTAS